MTKAELADLYNLSSSQLAGLLNNRYYDQLKELDYKKSDQNLSPKVVRKFVEIWGSPISKDELTD